jgi:SWI/SNF related-matrix-associated actin-dependent regulator of chromatin subfamily C
LGAISVCPLCYAEGRFPSELASTDFIHIDTLAFPSTSTAMRAQPWSPVEILALLEAVEEATNDKSTDGNSTADKSMSNSNAVIDWDAVAAKVGRPRDQCLLAFLRLPTIESLSESKDDQSSIINGFPYGGSVENPVLSTVAFLASMVHPKVAAAAASAAMATLAECKMDSEQPSSQSNSNSDLQAIAATAIGAAAARAAVLSGEEFVRLNRLRDTLIDLQLQKCRAKLQLFEDLERGLEADRKDVEQQRLQLFIDRFNLRKMMLKSAAGTNNNNNNTTISAPGSGNLTKL